MHLSRYTTPFLNKLPQLVQDLINGADSIASFTDAPPTLDAVLAKAQHRTIHAHHRSVLVEVLAEQNRKSRFERVKQAVDDLANPRACTVTTGHQLNVLGGPAYFVYKIAHTVALSRALENREPGLRVIPVFWMASEDHDFNEIARVKNFKEVFALQHICGGAVGPMPAAGLSDLASDFIASTESIDTETVAMLRTLSEQPNLAEATRLLVDHLFGAYGVVVLDASDARLKRLFAESFKDELLNEPSYSAIMKTNDALQRVNYPIQLTARRINLFYMSNGSRDGIVHEEGRYRAGNALDTDEKSILELVDTHPERFSPSAALRPVYQECILPNLAYVGGPGELSYWMQLKESFGAFGVEFPVLIPRKSVTVIGKKEAGWLAELGMDEVDLLEPLHVLTRRLVAGSGMDEERMSALRSKLNDLSGEITQLLTSIDPTLQRKGEATAARWLKDFEGLEKAILKARKLQEEIRVNRLERIHHQFAPKGPQEREINYFALAALSDEDLIERFVSDFQTDQWEWLVYAHR